MTQSRAAIIGYRSQSVFCDVTYGVCCLPWFWRRYARSVVFLIVVRWGIFSLYGFPCFCFPRKYREFFVEACGMFARPLGALRPPFFPQYGEVAFRSVRPIRRMWLLVSPGPHGMLKKLRWESFCAHMRPLRLSCFCRFSSFVGFLEFGHYGGNPRCSPITGGDLSLRSVLLGRLRDVASCVLYRA